MDASDDPIARFCSVSGVACHRGELLNVAARFKAALAEHPCDAFARVNGDSPLLDPSLLETGIRSFRQGGCDLAVNVHPRSYPKGQSVEVVDTATYMRTFPLMRTSEDQEHVTLHFYRNAAGFRIRNFASGEDLGNVQLSVDTPEDQRSFSDIVSAMDLPHWQYGYKAVLGILAGLDRNRDAAS
jgi:spore coat polysaccharide biosynthesis protein SpsF